eukprot:2314369-Prymnesium_polylepis.2
MAYAWPARISTPEKLSTGLCFSASVTCTPPTKPTVTITSPYFGESTCEEIVLPAPIAVSWP